MKGGGVGDGHHKIAQYKITVDHENYIVNFMKFKDESSTDYYLVVPEGYTKIPSWDEFPHKKKQLGNNLQHALDTIRYGMHGHIPEDENMSGGRKRKTRKTKKTRLTKRRRLT